MTVTIELSIELFKKFYNRKHIWRTKKKGKNGIEKCYVDSSTG